MGESKHRRQRGEGEGGEGGGEILRPTTKARLSAFSNVTSALLLFFNRRSGRGGRRSKGVKVSVQQTTVFKGSSSNSSRLLLGSRVRNGKRHPLRSPRRGVRHLPRRLHHIKSQAKDALLLRGEHDKVPSFVHPPLASAEEYVSSVSWADALL